MTHIPILQTRRLKLPKAVKQIAPGSTGVLRHQHRRILQDSSALLQAQPGSLRSSSQPGLTFCWQAPSLCRSYFLFPLVWPDPSTSLTSPSNPPTPPPPLQSGLPPSAGAGRLWSPLTDAGHAGHVQAVAGEAVTGEALGDAHAAAVGTAVQDPALLSLQSLVGPGQGACRECGDSVVQGLCLPWPKPPPWGRPWPVTSPKLCVPPRGCQGRYAARFPWLCSSPCPLSWSAGVFLCFFVAHSDCICVFPSF